MEALKHRARVLSEVITCSNYVGCKHSLQNQPRFCVLNKQMKTCTSLTTAAILELHGDGDEDPAPRHPRPAPTEREPGLLARTVPAGARRLCCGAWEAAADSAATLGRDSRRSGWGGARGAVPTEPPGGAVGDRLQTRASGERGQTHDSMCSDAQPAFSVDSVGRNEAS